MLSKDAVLSGRFEEDIRELDGILRVNESFDMIKRELVIAELKATIYYIDGFVKAESIQKLLMSGTSLK